MNPLQARTALGLGLLVALVAAATAQPPPTPAAPGFQVYHYASEVEGTAFREVFLVHEVHPDLDAAVANVELRRDGEVLPVTWEDADGALTVGDRFWFVQEAFDAKQVLTAHVDGVEVMRCRFGGGAGISIHPDEWREMGQPEQVRCLQRTDDQ